MTQLWVRKMLAGIILCIGIVYHFVQNTFKQAGHESFAVWFLLLSFVLLAFYSMSKYVENVQYKNQAALDQERNRMLAEHYKREIRQYEQNQIFFHDLKNQYLVLYHLLEAEEYEKAKEFFQKLKVIEYRNHLKVNTGIELLDALLEYKISEAESCRIAVDMEAVPIRLPMEDPEIIALFGNALDNAIEACLHVDDSSRWIRIAFSRIHEMTYIKIQNSCVHKSDQANGRFLSTKTDEGVHGQGMISMTSIVNKYEGNIKAEYGEKEFTLSICLYQ